MCFFSTGTVKNRIEQSQQYEYIEGEGERGQDYMSSARRRRRNIFVIISQVRAGGGVLASWCMLHLWACSTMYIIGTVEF